MFELLSPSKESLWDALYLRRRVSHGPSVWEHAEFSASVVFVSPSPHHQNVSLRIFHQGNKQKTSLRARSSESGGWGRGSGRLGLEHAARGGQVCGQEERRQAARCWCKSPVTEWANAVTESPKTFTAAERGLSQPRPWVHGRRWVLEHSPSGGTPGDNSGVLCGSSSYASGH